MSTIATRSRRQRTALEAPSSTVEAPASPTVDVKRQRGDSTSDLTLKKSPSFGGMAGGPGPLLRSSRQASISKQNQETTSSQPTTTERHTPIKQIAQSSTKPMSVMKCLGKRSVKKKTLSVKKLLQGGSVARG